MNMESYINTVKSDQSALKYELEKCLKNQQRFSPYCGSRKFWKLADKRRRCQRCKKVYHDLTGRWWNRVHLPMNDWLWIIKQFEMEVSARKISQEMGILYKTVFKALMTIRSTICSHLADTTELMSGEIEMDESYFGGKRKGNQGRGAAGKIPVFGILSRRGNVYLEVVPNVQSETLMEITKKVLKGSVIYTNMYKAYDALTRYGYRHLSVDHSSMFCNENVHTNGLEGFWSYAKERLLKYHGLFPRWFPLYLKEIEFRYNHQGEPLFDILVNYMSDLVPDGSKLVTETKMTEIDKENKNTDGPVMENSFVRRNKNKRGR